MNLIKISREIRRSKKANEWGSPKLVRINARMHFSVGVFWPLPAAGLPSFSLSSKEEAGARAGELEQAS